MKTEKLCNRIHAALLMQKWITRYCWRVFKQSMTRPEKEHRSKLLALARIMDNRAKLLKSTILHKIQMTKLNQCELFTPNVDITGPNLEKDAARKISQVLFSKLRQTFTTLVSQTKRLKGAEAFITTLTRSVKTAYSTGLLRILYTGNTRNTAKNCLHGVLQTVYRHCLRRTFQHFRQSVYTRGNSLSKLLCLLKSLDKNAQFRFKNS